MATLYIKYAKSAKKCFFQIVNEHGPVWPRGGYANTIFYLVKKL